MPLTVHHLQVSQSERVPWLCEELGIDYTLKNYKRAPLLAPDEYKALHHSGSAPVIQDGDITLAESGACLEYIAQIYGKGKFIVKPGEANYADYLYWWHWANGTFQPLIGRYLASRNDPSSFFYKYTEDKLNRSLGALEEQLTKNDYLAGSELTIADIMLVYTLGTGRYFSPFSLKGYPHIIKYLERTAARDAHKAASKKCDPDLPRLLGEEGPEKSFLEMQKKD